MAETVEDLLLEDAVPGFDIDKRVSLALITIGERPAVSVKFMDEEKKDIIEEFLDLTGFECLSFETGMHHKYYLAHDLDRFRTLEKVEEGSPYHTVKSEGLFLGYPRSAVEYFARNRREASEKFRLKVKDMLDKNLISEDKLYRLDLVCYIPEVSAEAILEALDHGRVREEALKQYDEENDSCLGEGLLEEVQGRSVPFSLR